MHIVNIHQAKTQFSKLVDAAANGEDIIIAKAGKPIAKLSSLTIKKPKRKPGTFKGKIWIADNFDAPLPKNILDEFEGK